MISETAAAAAGEHAARNQGASGFGFSVIVGSGPRSNAVVPTASAKTLQAGELVMIGIAPKVSGDAGVVGDSLPVSGKYTRAFRELAGDQPDRARIHKAYWKRALSIYDSIPMSVDERAEQAAKQFSELLAPTGNG